MDGVTVRRLRWSVGYGPPTTGWLLRPAGVDGPLPGVLGLHCHGGVRTVGGEQLVDSGDATTPRAARLREGWYAGRAPANDLARRGAAVLVHDAFSWGSRRFDLRRPTARLAAALAAHEARWAALAVPPDADERADVAADLHEDTLAKAAGVLGQTFAGLVLADDLVALEVLAADPGTDPARLGAFGFSGGGGRALLLAALDHRVRAAVVTCMMATTGSLVPRYLDAHSWLLHVPGLWSWRDWPELTAVARARFLVQYREQDALFPADGMRAAHARLVELHAGGDRYRGTSRPGEHAFDGPMQDEAWAFLRAAL
ncbi:acetylxylan esterase [Microlunatus capsulatus]|uniref:Dienelactone hydrolase n=1 Tax=Microlunatus capsulatus TaxID=99117 RepID=A0ABS4Z2I7_9ACTN|nr:acetylxylan esterase [Microlunatus capsulatus]MBP2415189.1 dienelactone hydrolase [Microlunatus capsulatus]